MDYSVKVTKRQLLRRRQNDMENNWYYLIHGRIYNADKTRYRKYRFVVMFDGDDLWEYYRKDNISEREISEYVDEMIFSFTQYIKGYNDVQEFVEICNQSIRRYNSVMC